MGGCMSAPAGGGAAKQERQRNSDIDKELESASRRGRQECRILLLGSGESGKSTIVKQMKIIHQNGYSREELMMFRLTIIKNVIDSIWYVVKLTQHIADEIVRYELPADAMASLPEHVGQQIRSLWTDPMTVRLMERRSEFYMMDNAEYFLEQVDRIARPDYLPTQDDVLHARTKTVGVLETRFKMGELSIHLIDVGGQRSERTKWIHCFEAVTSIIFCVALSEYDQNLLEDSGQNCMAESLVLFESVVNSRWFLRSSVILFLNKIDLFQKKLPSRPLADYFPEYTGGNDVNKAAKYILWRFTQVNHAKLSIYPHITQATDTNNIRVVFAAVKETLLQNSLREVGLL